MKKERVKTPFSGTNINGQRYAFMQYVEVPDYDDPTLTLFRRWRIIETPKFAVLLHHLMKSDSQTRGYHDHPWSFISIRLRRNYTNQMLAVGHAGDQDREFLKRSRFFSYMPRGEMHRVVVDDDERGCWTLVLRGKRYGDWGFRVPGGSWISHLNAEADLIPYRTLPDGKIERKEKAHG